MKNIAAVDKNFKVETEIEKSDIRFYDVDNEPFCVYGLIRDNGKYRRIPESVAKTVNDGVYMLHANTAGGRVRFTTNSRYVAIHAKMENIGKMPHFAFSGSAGFDLYVKNTYTKTFMPPIDIKDGYESVIEFDSRREREITINFPLYSDVIKLYIGLEETAEIKPASPYRNAKPIVYYGSSITQGGCASRPGMSYQSILSRKFNYDYINLGFSGSARAEDEIVNYIKNLEMSAFVLDYDHNAPSPQHLLESHEKMFLAIRKEHPDIPIIMMTRPKYRLTKDEKARREVVLKTYQYALARGDENVYFIDGKALTALCKDEGTVDNTHPTDYGFVSMAKGIEKVMKNLHLD